MTALILLVQIATGVAEDRPEKPNVVLILVDDLGWQDVGCYDTDEPTPFETPNIDQLAREGMQFWQGYSPAPTCSPTRGAILAGKYPVRLQRTHVLGGAPPTPGNSNQPLISPWFSGRLARKEITIAEALQSNDYRTGHAGKWHVTVYHHAPPQPGEQGFDFTTMNLGVTRLMKPDRLTDFASNNRNDPYKLDENGFPFDENTEDALTFLRENQSHPFFLYYATFLVHTPIQSRSEALLRKYCAKMGVPFPVSPDAWRISGQRNPYYGAMVEMLDYYVGRLLNYLKETDDPRWPGHKLSENTYVIFTSDNGGMEEASHEMITDNAPLDEGKIHAEEGGVRVPLIIKGPDIKAGTQSNAMISGIDFYPTILSWTGTERPIEQLLDGIDLDPYLKSDPSDSRLLADADGNPRDTLYWHFPHGREMESTIRKGNFKLIRNWRDYLLSPEDGLELFQLYDESGNRRDLEEAHNLANKLPEKTRELNNLLQAHLDETQASPPYLNPHFKRYLPGKYQVCKIVEIGREENRVWARFEERGARVIAADVIYTDNGGEEYEEWYRLRANIIDLDTVVAELPEGTTHYVFNLIHDNHFLVSYPRMQEQIDKTEPYSVRALSATRDEWVVEEIEQSNLWMWVFALLGVCILVYLLNIRIRRLIRNTA